MSVISDISENVSETNNARGIEMTVSHMGDASGGDVSGTTFAQTLDRQERGEVGENIKQMWGSLSATNTKAPSFTPSTY